MNQGERGKIISFAQVTLWDTQRGPQDNEMETGVFTSDDEKAGERGAKKRADKRNGILEGQLTSPRGCSGQIVAKVVA